jgi:D-alanine-D-alanine ligase
VNNKKTVVVLFGGQSSEHDVSRVSATTVIENIDSDKYYVIPVGITKSGKWMLYNGPIENIKSGVWEKYATQAIISPDASQKALLKIVGDKVKAIPIDLVFPVLHGLFGEDGSMQGLMELSGLPYVGCGILASAVGMDKLYTKLIVAAEGDIAQAEYVKVYRNELADIETVVNKIETKLGYPCFIKPSNAGSSVGITKAHDAVELKQGLKLAAEHDRKILVEAAIVGREVECAVIGNDDVETSTVGEVLAAAEFYDYEAKYNNSDSKTVIPAQLSNEIISEIQYKAKKIFKALDGAGLSRVDFFVENGTNRVVFNEINTLPGFTSISMYPMLWENAGISKPELINKLIELAFEKASDK